MNIMIGASLAPVAADTPWLLREHTAQNRVAVESLIRDRFRATYGANLSTLMPRLFTLANAKDETICAFGLREAAGERLFMEHYLDEPVERAISKYAGRTVPRHTIMEVGNLVSAPGGARAMIAALTRYLYQLGIEWVVFTGVAALRAAFLRLGLHPFVLGAADPCRLTPAELASWGRYFTARPQVMGGHVPSGFGALTANEDDAPWRERAG